MRILDIFQILRGIRDQATGLSIRTAQIVPFTTQFAVSLELAKILPVRAAISYSAESLVKLIRVLKRSGSDFLVEEDLAAIFGRGKIEAS